MHTYQDAEQYVTDCIEAGDASREDFDVEAIVRTIHQENGGSYDLSDFDHSRFWAIVEDNAR